MSKAYRIFLIFVWLQYYVLQVSINNSSIKYIISDYNQLFNVKCDKRICENSGCTEKTDKITDKTYYITDKANAQQTCIGMENCQAVYDVGCDGKDFYLCSNPLTLSDAASTGSCVYSKIRGNLKQLLVIYMNIYI